MCAAILIAEDEPFIVESVTFLLTRAGHNVRAVQDGAAALREIGRRRPDLLILDVMLPETNGFDVLQTIRSETGRPRLPVLVLTAKGQGADRERMAALDADDFVTKPFANADLLERVNALVAGAAASVRAS